MQLTQNALAARRGAIQRSPQTNPRLRAILKGYVARTYRIRVDTMEIGLPVYPNPLIERRPASFHGRRPH